MTFPTFHPPFVAIDLAVPRLHLGTIIAGLALMLGAAPAGASDETCPSFPAGANYETPWMTEEPGLSGPVVSGDLDGDGDLDLAGVGGVLLNQGDGTFAPAELLHFDEPLGVATGDLDGDGDLDLVFVGDGLLSVSLNNGDATFEEGYTASPSASFGDAALADLDGDGDLDLVCAKPSDPNYNVSGSGDSCWIFFNAGDGTFEVSESYVNPTYCWKYEPCPTYDVVTSVAPGDFDGDGDIDIVVGRGPYHYSEASGNGTEVLWNNGQGAFVEGSGHSTIWASGPVLAGDLDGDGDLDIVRAYFYEGLYVGLNNGFGSFTVAEVDVPGHPIPTVQALADLDGDGDLDVVVERDWSTGISVLLNDGDGAMTLCNTTPEVNVVHWPAPGRVVAADLDGDDVLDLVVPNVVDPRGGSEGMISVLLNALPAACPIEPAMGPAWADLGFSLAGTSGAPCLCGESTLAAGDPITLYLGNAAPASTAHLCVGDSALNFSPFFGGTFVPDITARGFIVPIPTSGDGTVTIAATWPAGVPSGFELYLQFWVEDAGGPFGLSASNGLKGTTP